MGTAHRFLHAPRVVAAPWSWRSEPPRPCPVPPIGKVTPARGCGLRGSHLTTRFRAADTRDIILYRGHGKLEGILRILEPAKSHRSGMTQVITPGSCCLCLGSGGRTRLPLYCG